MLNLLLNKNEVVYSESGMQRKFKTKCRDLRKIMSLLFYLHMIY